LKGTVKAEEDGNAAYIYRRNDGKILTDKYQSVFSLIISLGSAHNFLSFGWQMFTRKPAFLVAILLPENLKQLQPVESQ